MVEWGNERSWEAERGVAPAGGPIPAGETTIVPPAFLVYKRRLHALAKKAPVLDHRQASIDSILGTAQAPKPKPVHQVAPMERTSVDPRAFRRALPYGHRPVQTEADRRQRDRPRFVPRSV